MPPAAENDDDPGAATSTRFGRYAVVRELGKGGMALVFEGRHTELGSRVALKVMQPALAAQPMAAARFLREAKAASQIRHQHVVEVFDIDTERGLPFIVMEFLDGSNLAALLSEKGPLSLSGIADVFLPVISAVATAHAAGIIHRDLKPANLMITRRPPRAMHPMVLDFGISKITSEEMENTFTRSESLLGTVQYMAPELTRGAKFASPASDQYALGVMLYECATGKRPFAGASHYELMHAIVTAPVVPPSHLRSSLPPEFDALVEKAMNRDPAKRFPSVEAIGSALLSFGDNAAWALWETEFMGTPCVGEPWVASTSTFHDDPSTGGRARELPPRLARARSRRARWPSWLLASVSMYAVVATVFLVRRGAEKGDEPAACLPPSIVAAAISPTTASIGVADRAPSSSESSLPTEPDPAVSVAGLAASPPLANANRSVRRMQMPNTPVPPVQRSPDAAASVGSATSQPVINMGTNGAPIVE